jgi:pyrroloquinoline-quinone synthase
VRVASDDLLQQIAEIVRKRHHNTHPIQSLIFDGQLTPVQVREWIGQRSCIPLYNHLFHGPLYFNCPDPEWRSRIAEVVYEEATGRLYAGGVSHHELYLRLGEAVGIGRQELYDWPLCPEARGFMAIFEATCRRSFLEGVSAHMLAGEAQVPDYAGKLARALQTHYGLSAEQALFWTIHEEADADHSNIGRELLDRFARTEADQQQVLKTVRAHVEARWMLQGGIHRAVMAAGEARNGS